MFHWPNLTPGRLCKRPLDQDSVSFGQVYAYARSFLAQLFNFLCVVFSFVCFVPVKRDWLDRNDIIL